MFSLFVMTVVLSLEHVYSCVLVENRYMMKDHATNWTPPNEAYGRFSSLFNAKGNN